MSSIPLEEWFLSEETALSPLYTGPVAGELSQPPAQLRDRALQLAAGLRQQRIGRAILQFEDANELAVALLASWCAGVTAVLAAQGQTPSQAELDAEVPLDDANVQRTTLVLGDAGEATPVAAFLTTAQPQPVALAPARLNRNSTLVLCTSGSSGRPKLIVKQLWQLSAEVANLNRLWAADIDGAVVIGSVAAHHIYGLLYRVLWPLTAGRPFVRAALPFPEENQRLSLACQRAIWITSPALLKRLGDEFDWESLRAVRRILSSGGALPAETAATIHYRGGQWPIEIYGSSETGGIGWREGQQPWQPFPGVAVSCDARGALQVVSSYLPDETPFATEDAATLHDDGRFELGARLDRIIKLEDKRVSLPQIEQRLATHPWVGEARLAVLQQRRAFLGAVLALTPAGVRALRASGRRALTESLRDWLRSHTETLALPRRWRLLHELPFTPQGKLPLAVIEALLLTPRSREPERLEPVERQGETGDEWQVRLRIPLDLAHFSGHFPTSPVLPGVVQIGWALSIARQLMPQLPTGFGGMEVLKFQRLARPGDLLTLQLRWDATRAKLYFAYQLGSDSCSSGRILLGHNHG